MNKIFIILSLILCFFIVSCNEPNNPGDDNEDKVTENEDQNTEEPDNSLDEENPDDSGSEEQPDDNGSTGWLPWV